MDIIGNKDGKLIIAIRGFSPQLHGIYEEQLKIPNKIKEELENCNTSIKYDGWYRSNTAGITLNKYFKKISEPVEFKIKYNYKEIYNKNFVNGIVYLKELFKKDFKFRFNTADYKDYNKESWKCYFNYTFEADDYIHKPHILESEAYFNEAKKYFLNNGSYVVYHFRPVELYFNFTIDNDSKNTLINIIDNRRRKIFLENDAIELFNKLNIINFKWSEYL